MALAVAMAHAPGEHVGDRFEAAMRVVGKTGEIVLRPVRLEFVEQQEGIDHPQLLGAEHAGQADAGAVRGRLAAERTLEAAPLESPVLSFIGHRRHSVS
jgi:hypothetical protein